MQSTLKSFYVEEQILFLLTFHIIDTFTIYFKCFDLKNFPLPMNVCGKFFFSCSVISLYATQRTIYLFLIGTSKEPLNIS